MPIAGTTTSLAGRTVDLEAFQTVKQPLDFIQMTNTVAGGGISRRLAGLQKLIQRYTLLYLTMRGDVKFAQNAGTFFLRRMYNGAIATRGQVVHNFAFANSTVLEQLRQEDSDTDRFGPLPPDDERIASATLVDFNITTFAGSTLLLRVLIENLEGDSTIFVLPAK